jgi:hypothetical protein
VALHQMGQKIHSRRVLEKALTLELQPSMRKAPNDCLVRPE